jgi:hypothetical protein
MFERRMLKPFGLSRLGELLLMEEEEIRLVLEL